MTEEQTFGVSFDEPALPSWQTVLEPGEQCGGPTAHGNSWWSSFIECPRKFYWAHVKRLKPERLSDALEIGGLFHEAVARYHTKGVEPAWKLVDRAAEVTPIIALEARRLFSAWLNTYGATGLRPLPPVRFVELELSVEEPFPYSARIDSLFSDNRGGVVNREMKTTSRLTKDLLTGYELNSQFLGQAWLWEATGESKRCGKMTSFTVDLVVKTKTVQCEEVHVTIPRRCLTDWARNMRYLWGEMTHCVTYGVWPQHLTSCVNNWGKWCSFHRLCASGGKDKLGLVRKTRGEW